MHTYIYTNTYINGYLGILTIENIFLENLKYIFEDISSIFLENMDKLIIVKCFSQALTPQK